MVDFQKAFDSLECLPKKFFRPFGHHFGRNPGLSPGPATALEPYGGVYGGFSSLTAIIISETTQTFLNFIPSFCNGGLNSEKCLHLKRIGFMLFGTIEIYVLTKCRFFTKTTMSREYFISVSSIYGFEKKVVVKYETERLISADSETTDFFKRKWFYLLRTFFEVHFFSACLIVIIVICHSFLV